MRGQSTRMVGNHKKTKNKKQKNKKTKNKTNKQTNKKPGRAWHAGLLIEQKYPIVQILTLGQEP